MQNWGVFTHPSINMYDRLLKTPLKLGMGGKLHVAQNYECDSLSMPKAHQIYRKVSNIRRTKCHNLNDSRLVLQLSVPNPLKPSVKSIMKM